MPTDLNEDTLNEDRNEKSNENAGEIGNPKQAGNRNGRHRAYWDSLADHYRFQQPPLRPCAEDVALFTRTIADWSRRHPEPALSSLLLGVTPELAALDWPAPAQLIAVDKSRAMIDAVWSGDLPPRRRVIEDDWFRVPVRDGSLDFVVGDGFLTAFAFPGKYAELAAGIARWLKPEGLLVARLFVRPARRETLDEIAADLAANRVAQFDALRWRLAMALQDSPERGVALGDVYSAWRAIEEALPGLPERAGWPRATVETIRLYQGRAERYAFPTIEELNRAFAASLVPVSVVTPGYALGERCPLLAFRRRAR